MFTPILEYNGNASSSFTLDSGSVGPGPEGVLLQLKKAQQAKISTTDYLMYGYVEATLRHDARQGLVAAFITMSNIKDEIDWEFTTANASLGKTNYFWEGQAVLDHGTNVSPPDFNVSDWHTYGLNWTSSQLEWTIDGQVVRTLTRDQAGTSYPRSPSRIQFSTWAGGNATNPEGTIEWAGGLIDWDTPEYEEQGFYSQEIKQFNVQCASLDSLNLTSVSGNGTSGNVTSFVYTGANSSQTLEPAFGTSTAPLRILADPGADGYPGYPGYGVTSSSSKGGKDAKGGKGSSTGSGQGGQDGQSTTNNDSAKSSSSSTSDALKYALPISGAVIGLAALWAIIAFVRSRHRKSPEINAIGVTGINDPRFSGTSSGGYARAAANLPASAYQDLEHEPASMYRHEPNMNLMVGGGIMSDAGLSHLQRQTTSSSKLSRSSSRSVADRLLRDASKQGQRYHQLNSTVEEEDMDELSKYSVSRTSTGAGGSSSSAPRTYRGHSYIEAAQEVEGPEAEAQRYNYYGTPVSSPVKRSAEVAGDYSAFNAEGNSFEACQLRAPRRALPSTPYMPNYAPAPQRPSGRLYDTPNVNYYPTPVMTQSEQQGPSLQHSGAYASTHATMAHGAYPPPRPQ